MPRDPQAQSRRSAGTRRDAAPQTRSRRTVAADDRRKFMKTIAQTLAAACVGLLLAPHAAGAADMSDMFAARLKLQLMKAETEGEQRTETTRSLSVITPATARAKPASLTPTEAMASDVSRPAIALATVDTKGAEIVVQAMAEDSMISEPVLFQINSAFLTDQARGVLDIYCESIKKFERSSPEFASASYVLIGHADASGDASYNLVLSRKRAEEARRYMVSSCGIAEVKIRAAGLGEERLFDPSNPRSSANRRVELQLGS
jgi:outer membrane protein OmpA-like peptidoglycan-associated protein